MPLNPNDYGWALGVYGHEPVPTLDTMASDELQKSRAVIAMKNSEVERISACGVCKGITCRNCSQEHVWSGEDIASDC